MQMQLCQGVARCTSKFVRLCSYTKPGLLTSTGISSILVTSTSGCQASPVVLRGSRTVTSRAATAAGSTVIYQVPSDGFEQLQSPRITLVGNLGRDVEIKQVNSRRGPMEVGVTSLALTQDDQSTLWVKLNFWNQDAHAAAENLRKGMKVEVYGTLKQNTFTRKDGTPGHSVDVSVNSIRQVESKKQQPSSAGPYGKTMGAGKMYVNEDEEYFEDANAR